jgi:hypothetical protein
MKNIAIQKKLIVRLLTSAFFARLDILGNLPDRIASSIMRTRFIRVFSSAVLPGMSASFSIPS